MRFGHVQITSTSINLEVLWTTNRVLSNPAIRNPLMPNNLHHGPSANDPLARRDPLAALPAFAAADELAAPGTAGIDDAEPVAAAMATPQPAMAFATIFSHVLHGRQFLRRVSKWTTSGNTVTSDIRVTRRRHRCKEVQRNAGSLGQVTQQ